MNNETTGAESTFTITLFAIVNVRYRKTKKQGDVIRRPEKLPSYSVRSRSITAGSILSRSILTGIASRHLTRSSRSAPPTRRLSVPGRSFNELS